MQRGDRGTDRASWARRLFFVAAIGILATLRGGPASGSPTACGIDRTADDGSAFSLRGIVNNPACDYAVLSIPTTDPGYNSSTGQWTIQLNSTLDINRTMIIEPTSAGTPKLVLSPPVSSAGQTFVGIHINATDVGIHRVQLGAFSDAVLVTQTGDRADIAGNYFGPSAVPGISNRNNFNAIDVLGAQNVTITGNRIWSSDNAAIAMSPQLADNFSDYGPGPSATISQNLIGVDDTGAHVGNNNSGILGFAATATISQNTIVNSAYDGIYLRDYCANGPTSCSSSSTPSLATISSNTISDNGGNGIYAKDSTPQIDGNTISGNGTHAGITGAEGGGIELWFRTPSLGAEAKAITNNVITGNTFKGIRVAAPTDSIQFSVYAPTTITGNTISGTLTGSGGYGFGVGVAHVFGVDITSNSITSNAGLGIDLIDDSGSSGVTANDQDGTPPDHGLGGNYLQNYPDMGDVLTDDTTVWVNGSLNSIASKHFRIDYYLNADASNPCDSSGYGEGATYLTSQTVATDSSGAADIGLAIAETDVGGSGQRAITTTATILDGFFNGQNTSEFSGCVPITQAPTVTVVGASGSESDGATAHLELRGSFSSFSHIHVATALQPENTVDAADQSDFTAASHDVAWDFFGDAVDDYWSAPFPVVHQTDSLYENTETYLVKLTNPWGVRIDPLVGDSAVMSITDSTVPNISIESSLTLPEPADPTPSATGTLTITADHVVASDVSIEYSVGESDDYWWPNHATADEDFTSFNTNGTPIVMEAGTDSVIVNVTVLNDNLGEQDQHFSVRLLSVSGPAALSSSDVADVVIPANDKPTFTILPPDTSYAADSEFGDPFGPSTSIPEGDASYRYYEGTVQLSNPVEGITGIDLHPEPTGAHQPQEATSDTDFASGDDFYGPHPFNGEGYGLFFFTGDTEARYSFIVFGDTNDEYDETFNIVGQSWDADMAADPEPLPITIVDDDTPQLTVDSVIVTEGEQSGDCAGAVLTVGVDRAAKETVSFTAVAVPGTATTDDYSVGTIIGVVAAGDANATTEICVPIVDDHLDEPTESFTVHVVPDDTGVAGPSDGVDGTITIIDDDVPTWSIGDIEVNESDGAAMVPVTLSIAPKDASVFVHFATGASGDSAVNGSDYVATAVDVEVDRPASGPYDQPITVYVPVSLINDNVQEAQEFFTVTLSAADESGATSIGGSSAAVTIDDEDTPAVSIPATIQRDETSGTAQVTLTLSKAPAADGSVFVYSTAGTATGGLIDYTDVSQTVPILAGQTTATFNLTINDDVIDEHNETFTLTLLNPSAGLTLGNSTSTVTIIDDDVPQFSVVGATVNEGAGTVTIKVQAPIPPVDDATVTLSTEDLDATAGQDYTAVSNVTVDLPAGHFFGTTTVPILDDNLDEFDEHFWARIANPSSGIGIDNDSAIVTIVNDDIPTWSIGTATFNEADGVGTVPVTLSVAPKYAYVQVNFATGAMGDTAVAPGDYTAASVAVQVDRPPTGPYDQPITVQVPIEITNDNVQESTESFTATLTDFDSFGDTVINPDASSAAVTILDDDVPAATIDGGATFTEGDGAQSATLHLSKVAAADVEVTITATPGNPGAVNPDDYTGLPATVTIPQGATSASVPFSIVDDSVNEATETFSLAASLTDNGASGVVVGSPSSTTFTILDDDPVTISAGDVSTGNVTVNEGDGTVSIPVRLDKNPVNDVTFDVSLIAGSATTADYGALTSSTGTIVANPTASSWETTVVVPITDDLLDELDETFTVQLSNISGARPASGSTVSSVVTIVDNDDPVVSIDDVTVSEGAGTATLHVSIDQAPAQDVTVHVATISGGTATLDDDYTDSSADLTFLAGHTESQAFVVPIVDDTDVEQTETVFALLTDIEHGVLGDSGGTISIVDNDVAQLSVSDTTVTEGPGAVATVSVSLDRPTTSDVTFAATTTLTGLGSTDAETGDFGVPSTNGLIPAGSLSTTITVPINDDNLDEFDETFNVVLSNVSSNVGVLDGTGQVTIVDDDVPTWSVTGTTVNEPDGVANVTVALDIAPKQPVTVDVSTVAGSATAPSDYTSVTTQVTLDASTLSTIVAIPIVNDEVQESSESLTAELAHPATGTTVGAGSATVTITDDDLPVVTIDNATLAESAGATSTLVHLSKTPATDVVLHVTSTTPSSNAATPDEDYDTVDATVVVPQGQRSAAVPLTILQDTIDEADESFGLTATATSGIVDVSAAAATITIVDDDVPQLSVGDITVVEGPNAVAMVPVTLDIATFGGVSFDLDTVLDGTASDADLTPARGTGVVLAGQKSTVIPVPIQDDRLDEFDETFTVVVNNVVGATVLRPSGTVTIVDDDVPAWTVTGVTVDESAGHAVVDLSVDIAPVRPITVGVSTVDDSALADADYTALASNAVVTLAAGQTQTTLSIPIIDDTTPEPTEDFFVDLANPTDSQLASRRATVTITDTDVPVTTTTTSTTLPPTTTTTSTTSTTVPPTTTTSTTLPPTTTTTVRPTTTTARPTTTLAPTTTTTVRPTTTTSTTSAPPPATTTPPTTAIVTTSTLPVMPDVLVINETPTPTTIRRAPTTSVATTSTSTSTTTTTTQVLGETEDRPPAVTVHNPSGGDSSRRGGKVHVNVTDLPPGSEGRVVHLTINGEPWMTTTVGPDNTVSFDSDLPDGVRVGNAEVSVFFDGQTTPIAMTRYVIEKDESFTNTNVAEWIPAPRDLDFSPSALARTAGVTASVLLLFAFPSELFDSTFEANEERIRAVLPWTKARPEQQSHRRRLFSALGCMLAGGAIFTALIKPFSLNVQTLMVFVGFTVAVAACNFGLVAPDYFFVRARYGERGVLNSVPGGLIVGGLCVLASKLFGFNPGYIYGVVAGWAFRRELTKRDEGEMATLTTFLLLALAYVSWLLAVPISSRAAGGAVIWTGLQATVSGLFLLSLESAVVGMLPLRFVRGKDIWEWNRWVWVGTSFVVVATFVHILITPGYSFFSASNASLRSMLVLLATFGSLSVGFWAWFRFRPSEQDRHDVTGDGYIATHRVIEEPPEPTF